MLPGMPIAFDKPAYSVAELPLAAGVSRRTAMKIAHAVGRRVDGRYLVLHGDLVRYLEALPKPAPRSAQETP